MNKTVVVFDWGGGVCLFFSFFFTNGKLLIHSCMFCVHNIDRCGRKGSRISVKNQVLTQSHILDDNHALRNINILASFFS